MVEDLNKYAENVPILLYGNGLLDYSLLDINKTKIIWNSSNGYDILIPEENCEIDVWHFKKRHDMSSILKILVDIQCLVYCDFEEVGEAFPNSILKIELRKGIYIIDFKKDNISLKSIKYKITTDNEDYLLEESLASIYVKEKETKRNLKHLMCQSKAQSNLDRVKHKW